MIPAKRKKWPVALTIAGSDSGGGAGIQADLKTFAAFSVHGASAIACLTAQNPAALAAIEPCSAKMLRRQIQAVFDEMPPAAVKIGMLFSCENVLAAAAALRNPACPIVLDPVLVSTSGRPLLEPGALKILGLKLLPAAAIVTPNIREAALLSGRAISSREDMSAAARTIHSRFGCRVLLKGGHLHPPQGSRGQREAVDLFFDGKKDFFLEAPFIENVRTHGTGCVLSAAVCAALAWGNSPTDSVKIGKNFVTAAIARGYRIGRHFALDTGFQPRMPIATETRGARRKA